MPRMAKVVAPGFPHHVTQRGNRRQQVFFNETDYARYLWVMSKAFPWDPPPKYVVRDRDQIYGEIFRRRVKSLGMEEVLIAPRSPWQNPYAERLIGSIRRDCLDHHIISADSITRTAARPEHRPPPRILLRRGAPRATLTSSVDPQSR